MSRSGSAAEDLASESAGCTGACQWPGRGRMTGSSRAESLPPPQSRRPFKFKVTRTADSLSDPTLTASAAHVALLPPWPPPQRLGLAQGVFRTISVCWHASVIQRESSLMAVHTQKKLEHVSCDTTIRLIFF
jgi:hypothetical protein